MLKQILVPVAALAITATSVSAFNSDMLSKLDIDLTDAQVSALEEAQEIREDAMAEAKLVLEDAGLDEEAMREIHVAMREAHDESREAIQTAIKNNDYTAFTTLIADSPFSEAITSEADFAQLVEAHTLMEAGDHDAAKEIMDELGIEHMGGRGHHGMGGPNFESTERTNE